MRPLCGALFILFAACGDKVVYRPLEVDVEGISSQAHTLVLKAFPASTGQTCMGVGLSTVQSLATPLSMTWTRGVDAQRMLSLPSVNEPSLTLVVYTESSAGMAIQYVCVPVMFENIETGVIIVRLNAQPQA